MLSCHSIYAVTPQDSVAGDDIQEADSETKSEGRKQVWVQGRQSLRKGSKSGYREVSHNEGPMTTSANPKGS